MAEVYTTPFTYALMANYAAGNTTISVSAAAPSAIQTGTFRVRLGNASQTVLIVTNAGSGTTWNVTAENNDASAASGTNVYGCEVSAGMVTALFSDFRANNVRSLWAGTSDPNGSGADFAPHNMTSGTAPTPYVVTDSGHYSGEAGWKCFDGLDGEGAGVFIGSGTSNVWVVIDLGSGVTSSLYSYAIKANTSSGWSARQPNSWNMQGSNDNSTWTTVDSRSGEISWGMGEVRLYTLSSTSAAYRYWRLYITVNNGDSSWTEVDELYLYQPGTLFSGGAVGDFFMDYSHKRMYGPKASSGTLWPVTGNLT